MDNYEACGAKKKEDITILESSVGYGQIATGGDLGYENKRVDVPGTRGWTAISAHAPSKVVIQTNGPIEIIAAQNNDLTANRDHLAMVDGELIGKIKEAGSKTLIRLLEPGIHTLEFPATDNEGKAHTLWLYRTAPSKEDQVQTRKTRSNSQNSKDTKKDKQ